MRQHDDQRARRVQAHASPLFHDPAAGDVLETDIHVLTLNEFLADQPSDWTLPAASPKQPSQSQICPESPCSADALEATLQCVPATAFSNAHVDSTPLDLTAYVPDDLLAQWFLWPEPDDEVKRENPQQQNQQLQPTSIAHVVRQSPPLVGDAVEEVGKERLRKRQRMYEQKYRKKKKASFTNFKQMRREWICSDTLLYSHQAQHAHAIPQATNSTARTIAQPLKPASLLQAQLAQLRLEEQALVRDRILLTTAKRWQALFEIHVPDSEDLESAPKDPKDSKDPKKIKKVKLPKTMREWELLADSAMGLSYVKPFVLPSFSFSW